MGNRYATKGQYTAAVDTAPRRVRGWWVAAALGGVVAAAAVVAVVASGGGGSGGAAPGTGAHSAARAVQERASVTVAGEDLPPAPANISLGGADSPAGTEAPRLEGASTTAPNVALGDASDPAVGRVAPRLEGQGFDGSPVTVTPGDGRARLVVFLAHWCPHCRAEVPVIEQWIRSGAVPEGLEVVAVSTAASEQRPNWPPSRWIDREGFTPQVMLDDAAGTAAVSYGVSGFPFLVFTDASGRVTARGSGEVPVERIDTAARAAVAGRTGS